MLTKVVLENYRSFGARQEIPLEPLTVIVGPNGSGKSVFMGVPAFLQDVRVHGFESAVQLRGGLKRMYFQGRMPAKMVLGCSTDKSTYEGWLGGDREVEHGAQVNGVAAAQRGPFSGGTLDALDEAHRSWRQTPCYGLETTALASGQPGDNVSLLDFRGKRFAPLFRRWRSEQPELAEETERFVQRCFPGVRHVLVGAEWPEIGKQERRDQPHYWFRVRYSDGLEVDAPQLSSGVLLSIALGMIAANHAAGTIFLEEPETGLHPTLLENVANLLKEKAEAGIQVVVSTHSPRLVNEFKDTPEAILLFRVGKAGSEVRRMSSFPKLVENLHRQEPGEMLEQGFFTTAFDHLK